MTSTTPRPQPARTRSVARRSRRAAAMAALALLGMTGAAAPAQAQAAADPASIRLAHLSPDTPRMDVYVAPFDGTEKLVLPGVGFGDVSEYLQLDDGVYTFSMRPAGAPETAPAVISESATVEAGAAYTFAALGLEEDLDTVLLDDDLTPPPAGEAKVRIVQAAIDTTEVDLRAVDGPVLADGATFGTVTDYATVPAGSWEVSVEPSGGAAGVVMPADLDAGAVYSLVLLANAEGDLELNPILDAAGTPGMPTVGAIATGGGGTAEGGTGNAWAPWMLTAPAVVVAGALALSRQHAAVEPVTVRSGPTR